MANLIAQFEEFQHPRAPAGSPTGGQFVEKPDVAEVPAVTGKLKVQHRAFLPGSDTPEKKYIRFGRIPKGEVSTVGQSPNFVAAMLGEVPGKKLEGVSVFDVEFNAKRNLWELNSENLSESGLVGFDELTASQIAYDKLIRGGHKDIGGGKQTWSPPIYKRVMPKNPRPIFLVTGDDVGEGTDGEPLLKNVKIIDQLNVWDLLHEGYFDPDTDINPEDAPRAFGLPDSYLDDYNKKQLEKDTREEREYEERQAAYAALNEKDKKEAAKAFVSPNVLQLSFDEAIKESEKPLQIDAIMACSTVDQIFAAASTSKPVLGAWKDGAENSIMVTMPGVSLDEAKVMSAMKGWLTDQKSVLVFKPDENGKHFMAEFYAGRSFDKVHSELLDNGLEFHTLEYVSPSLTKVHIFGKDQATADAVNKAAGRYGSIAQITTGTGEFIGTEKEDGTDREQRDDARKVYEGIIEAAAVRGKLRGRDVRKAWDDIRNRWSYALEEGRMTAREEASKK